MNKSKNKVKEKNLLILTLCFLLASCGGGGGGGGGSSNLPIKPSNPANFGDAKVAILDSDFITNKDELKAKYINIEILDRDPIITNPSTDNHGEKVLEILRKDSDFGVIAASIGERDSGGGDFLVPTAAIYKAALEKMGANGIKVFNQSFGTEEDMLDPTFRSEGNRIATLGGDLAEGTKIYDFYRDTVTNKKGIFVWAAGNEEEDNASFEAGLPHYYPDLEKGWISVVGVNTDDNIRTNTTGKININHYYNPNEMKETKLSYAGAAKWWSIASDFHSLPFTLPDGKKAVEIGSSYAAPRVSRAIVLVSDEYPWMTPDQIRQTLFTTTDQTEIVKVQPGPRRAIAIPDDKYGWGMLNSYRAQDGPGAFINTLKNGDNSTFNANIPGGMTSEFNNNIWGYGKLEKSGAGTLKLTANNSYTGGSVVSGGILEIQKIHASGVKVNPAGTLMLGSRARIGYNSGGNLIDDSTVSDANIIAANVDNYGTVKFNGAGAIIGGNYTGYAGSMTQANFTDNVTVKGTYTNNGTLKVFSNKYIATESESSAVISAGNISELGEVVADGMKTASAKVDGGNIVVELSRENVVDYVGNVEGTTKNVAESVEKVFTDLDQKMKSGVVTQEELVMGATIQQMSKKAFAITTEKMSGEIYASAQALTFSQAQNINRDLSNRLSGLNNLKLSNGEVQTWISAIGSNGKLRKSGYASADTHVVGGQFGVDKKINDTTNLGIAMSYSYANADFNRYAGDAKSDMVGLSLYGKKELGNNFYTAGRIGIAHISTKVERELVDSTGTSVQGRVKHDDIMTSFYLEAGKKFAWLTPFIGYSNDYLRRGSFSESNAAWGIHADSKNYWNTNLLLGLRAKFAFEKYKLQSYVTQAINVGKRDLTYEGHFTGNTTRQRFKGIEQAKNTTWIGLGVFREFSPNFGIYGNIDFRIEDGKRADSVFSTGLQYKF